LYEKNKEYSLKTMLIETISMMKIVIVIYLLCHVAKLTHPPAVSPLILKLKKRKKKVI